MKLLSVFVLSLLFLSSFAQAILPDKHYTTHDGLPQIQVMDMLQDSRGYIWVATKKGLARFNGEKFTKVVVPNVSSQHFNHIYQDEKGRLYFFTGQKEGTVIQYDGHSFRPLTINKNFLGRSYLNKIKDNKLFVVTNTKEVLRYDLDSLKQVESIFLPDTINMISKLADQRLVGFRQLSNKLFDIESKEVIYEVEKPTTYNIKMNQRGLENILIRSNYEGGRQMQLLGSKLEKIDLSYHRKAPDYSTLNNLNIENNNGFVFLNSADEVLLASGKNIVSKYKVSNTTRVICMMDIDDNLWISHENGVEFFSKNRIGTVPLELVSDAWTFTPSKDHFIYSSYSDGLFKVDLENNSKTPIFLPTADRLNYGAAKDNKGNIYLPGNRFIYKYDGSKKVKSYPVSSGNLSLVTYYDSLNNTVLVGGNKSVGFLKPDGDQIEYFDDSSDTVISRYVVSMDSRDRESYWIGTYRDLAVFNINNKSYSSYNHLFPPDSCGAISLAVDSENLWVGNTTGLWCLDLKTQSLVDIGKQAFYGEYINSLLVLPNQILAIGSSNGFSILNLREYNDNKNVVVKTFNYKNGFLGEEVAQSGLILEGNRLYIPSSTYLSFVDINNLSFEEDYSNIVISKINGKTIPWNNSSIVKMPASENNISISFEGLGFNKPHETRYSFMLENVDDEWSAWNTEDKVSYNNLSSGTYSFKVKSQTSNFNFKNKIPVATLDFELDLPLHKEPNFYKYAFLSLLGLSLLSFYLFWRYRKAREVNIIQDQQIKYLEVQALQSQMNPHFIFNVLGTIQALILNKQTEEANKYLVSFSKLIRRFLDASVSSNIDRNNIHKDNNVSLSDEIELIQLYVDFELLQYKDKFDFELEVQRDNLLHLFLPPMIIQPFVENAIKHGLLNKETKGKLLVKFSETSDSLVCTIDDNGIGREAAKTLQEESINLYTSRGSELVYQRVKFLNSMDQDISIKTIDKQAPESGTKVTITFAKKSIS